MKIRPARAELYHAGGQTHRHTDGWTYMTELTVAFHNHVNSPKQDEGLWNHLLRIGTSGGLLSRR